MFFELYLFFPEQRDLSSVPCPYSLTFIDGEKNQDVLLCSGREREKVIYTSQHHAVQVYVSSEITISQNDVLLTRYRGKLFCFSVPNLTLTFTDFWKDFRY